MFRTLLRSLAIVTICFAPASVAIAQQQIDSRVDIAWNRFYDYDQTTELLHKLADAYPNLITLESIGKSWEGREMWLVILNNDATGKDTDKPAMWIDGNIHGNEVQASETVLYSIWYLASAYDQVPKIREIVDRVSFYFLPMANPDGRAAWFAEPTTSGMYRSGVKPTDIDRDGQKDEDGPNDIDGDGHIGTMWRFDPMGTHRRNPQDPRIIERVGPNEVGELSFLGTEGYDVDGDGRINEDPRGGYDMNRNWPSDWQPDHVQRGAGDFPFSYPETRAIGKFILSRPNIAAGQSYHNTGGMILRGPGAAYRANEYPRSDIQVYDELGRLGEEMLPFYNYLIIHSDLYTVYGGFVNWLAEGLGIISFTNELWTDRRILQNPDRRLDTETRMRWQDRMLFGQTFTDWTEHDHPQYGRVLIGGNTSYASRTPPPFMLEEECHRNFAFTVFHADSMPKIDWRWIDIKHLGGDLWQVTLEIANDRVIPTRTARAASRRIGLPDRLVFDGGSDISVITSGTMSNRFAQTMNQVEHRPHIIFNESGIPSRGHNTFRFLITGTEGSEFTLRYHAEKTMDLERTFQLRPGEQTE